MAVVHWGGTRITVLGTILPAVLPDCQQEEREQIQLQLWAMKHVASPHPPVCPKESSVLTASAHLHPNRRQGCPMLLTKHLSLHDFGLLAPLLLGACYTEDVVPREGEPHFPL